jgi:ligand-binding sensor domain-containing protein
MGILPSDADGLLSNSINCITQDKSGSLWFGTFGGGACRYDGKSITNFTTKEWISSLDVNSIMEDKAGHIWFGTNLDQDSRASNHYAHQEHHTKAPRDGICTWSCFDSSATDSVKQR